jgi:hypothetical protein
MSSRSCSGSSNGRTAPSSSRRTATLLTMVRRRRVGVERFADQIVDHAGAVVLGRVDVIDSRGYRGLEHADGRCPVRWRPKGVRAGGLHPPCPDRLTSIWPSAKVDIMSASRLESAPQAWRNDGIEISWVMST